MKIMSWDQATNLSGYCYTEDGNYITSGVIDKHKNKNIESRVAEMGLAICAKIKEYQPDVVIIENIQDQKSPQTIIHLARLQGCVMLYCASKGFRLEILEPTKWRSALSYHQGRGTKREELKQQSFEFVKNYYGIDDKSEDETEAIAINVAAQILLNNTK